MKKILLFAALLGLTGIAIGAQSQDWQAAPGGRLPALATPVGYSATGAILYLARGFKSGRTSLGWFDSGTNKATLNDGSRASAAASFEIYTAAGKWVAATADALPAGAIAGSSDGQGGPILRVSSAGWLIPAVLSPDDGAAVAFIGGQRSLFSSFEVLVPDWGQVGDANALRQAFAAARDRNGNLNNFRAPQGSGLHPGKYSPQSKTGWISYGGKEIVVRDPKTEIFTGTGVWTAADGGLPLGAIRGGYDNDGSPLYMIRAQYSGDQVLGKYNDARREAYIPFGGKEIKVTDYEILCYDLARDREESEALVMAAPAQAAPEETAASLVDEAIRRTGLKSVLSMDFNRQANDLSPARASTSTRALNYASGQGSNYGIFDGRSTAVDVDYPRDISLSRMTVLIRVKSAFNKTWQALLNSRGWNETNAHFQFLDGVLEFAVNGNTPANFDLDYGFRAGRWYQIVLVYDMRARSAAVYVDGAKAGTIAFEVTVPVALGSMQVGAWDGEDRFLSGQIDYLHVLNGIMSERDILSSFPYTGGS